MRFDVYEAEFDGQWEDVPGSGKPLATDGSHPAQVTKVREWRSGEGVTVTFEIEGGEFAPVDLLMNRAEERGHKAAVRLLAAIGQPGREIDGLLVGGRVEIVTKRGINKKDDAPTVYVNGIKPIGGVVPASAPVQPPPPDRKPAARTNAAKVAQSQGKEPGGEDDIPF